MSENGFVSSGRSWYTVGGQFNALEVNVLPDVFGNLLLCRGNAASDCCEPL